MLGILMGLIAWVADAVISWHFFPGKSFQEMLFENDPVRTLYVRSTVVILFFLFGYVAGHLLGQQEKSNARLTVSLNLLSGIRQIHELIVKAKDPERLFVESIPLLQTAFGLDNVLFCRAHPEKKTAQECFSNLGVEEKEAFYQQLKREHPHASQLETIQQVPVHAKPANCNAYIVPIRIEDRLYGLLYGTVASDQKFLSDQHQEHLQAICNDLAYAFAHMEDQTVLAANAQKLEDLYRTAPVGIFTSTVGGEYLFLNPTMADLLGADSPESILQSGINVRSAYVDENRRDHLLQLLFEKKAVIDFEVDVKGLDGAIRTLVLAARLIPGATEHESRIDGFAMDMTISRSAERKNRILQQELNKARYYKSITVLAGGIAHEFNNILQAMMGSAYLAQIKIQDRKSEIWGYMQDIQSSGKRAAKLCDQMLSYAGKKAMILKMESPDAALSDALKIARSELNGQVRLEEHLDEPKVKCRLDIPSFSEVINQLISNSVESFEDGKGEIQVTTGICSCDEETLPGYEMTRKLNKDDYWYMRLSDNGSGITSKDLPHIFEPFFTTKFQGRGLGLPAVAGTVQKFDGSLGAKRLPEGGSEFILMLPLADAVMVESAEDELSAGSKKELQHAGGQIWVVDDEPLICMTIERLLSRFGFEVKTAGDGLEALERIKAVPVEEVACLLLDVTMPKMGGFETLTEIRKFAPDLPVLIMSGFDESDSLEKLKALNVAGFIHKPFRMEHLEAKLGKILTLTKAT
jgi:signal transduction histidine kinase